jgi:adenylate cyclase
LAVGDVFGSDRGRGGAWRAAAAAALAAALIVVGLRELGILQPVELWAYDRTLAARVALTGRAAADVVVVGVDEAALQRFGDPVRDEVLADALRNIAADAPVAVGLDLFRDLAVPPGTAELAEVLRATPSLVAVYAFARAGDRTAVGPPPSIADRARLGFADMPLDADGVVRRGLLFASVEDDDEVRWSLALRLALRALAPAGIMPVADARNPAWLRLGASTLRPLAATDGLYQAGDAGGYQFLLTFPAGRVGIMRVDFADVVAGALGEGVFRNKVVLVGLTDTIGSRDVLQTPMALGSDGSRRLPGVELHAHIVVQLVRQALGETRPLRALGDVATALLGLGCAVGGATFATLPIGLGLRLAGAVGLVGLFAAGGVGAMFGDLWVSTPTLVAAFGLAFTAATAAAARRHFRERAAVFALFGMHLSPRIAEIAWRERATFLERGLPPPQELTATVLFADLAGFTSLSRELAPAKLMRWINRYIARMTAIVDGHGGIVEKYSGDGFMVLFGIPIPRTTAAEIDADARAAAAAALAMRDALTVLNRENARDGLPAMRMRIGIATGRLIAGTTGGINRLQYTVLGDAANVAARLESFRKDEATPACDGGHTRILVSESTWRRLGPRFAATLVDSAAALRGRGEPLAVYALMDRAGPATTGEEPDD